MQLRIPRPIHGWRQFAGEVGIIVVGVLIALGAQQMVEDRHWNNQVTEARASLDAQLIESKFASMERIEIAACTDRKLDFIDEVIAGKRPAEGLDIRIGALRLWSISAWDSATASGAVARMPAKTRNDYASLFSFTAALGAINRTEFETAASLRTLERHPELTDVSRDRLAQGVAKMRAINRILKLGSGQWLEGAEPLGLKFSKADENELKKPQDCVMPDGSKVQFGTAAA